MCFQKSISISIDEFYENDFGQKKTKNLKTIVYVIVA